MQLTQVQPSQEQMTQLIAYPKDMPLTMLNIIKFKSKTEIGNETGKQAYARYFKNAQIVANDRSIALEYGSLIACQTLK